MKKQQESVARGEHLILIISLLSLTAVIQSRNLETTSAASAQASHHEVSCRWYLQLAPDGRHFPRKREEEEQLEGDNLYDDVEYVHR